MSSNVVPLFRPESLKARQIAWLGGPALALGLPTRALTVAVVLLAAAAASLVAFGSYARRINLRGVVVPQSGLVNISAPTGGWIQSINVVDGQEVAEGAILYHVNVDTTTSSGDTQQTIIRALTSVRAGLNQEIERKTRIRDEQDRMLSNKLENLSAQIAQMGVQIGTETDFEQNLQQEFRRISDLASRGLSTRDGPAQTGMDGGKEQPRGGSKLRRSGFRRS